MEIFCHPEISAPNFKITWFYNTICNIFYFAGTEIILFSKVKILPSKKCYIKLEGVLGEGGHVLFMLLFKCKLDPSDTSMKWFWFVNA